MGRLRAARRTSSRPRPGCKVNTKDGASSDDMISLIQTGEYDGVSASGNASVRLMTTGEVAPINTDFIPNYADVQEGIKNQDYNSLDGAAVRRAARPRPELPHVPQRHRPRGHDSWSVIWEDDELQEYKREDLDLRRLDLHRRRCRLAQGDAARSRDRQPVPAQRGAVQRGRRPAEEAGAASANYWPGDVAKQIGEYTNGDSVVGTTWPYQYVQLTAADPPCRSRRSSRPRARPGGRTRG